MLTGRGILVSCAIPTFFFALLNVFFLSDSDLQAIAAIVEPFLEVQNIKIPGAELTLKAQGVAFVIIALLWGFFIWLARYPILNFYSGPIRRSRLRSEKPLTTRLSLQRIAALGKHIVHPVKRILKYLTRLLPMPSGQLGIIAQESRDLIRRQYGLVEPSLIWPLLVSVVPDKFLRELENNSIFLYFFLNLSISAYAFAVETLVAMIRQQSLSFGIAGIVSLGFCYGFYAAAIPVAGQRLLYERSCFDLFRMDLLKQIRMVLPETLEEEFAVWVVVHSLLSADVELDPDRVHYVTSDKDEQA